MAFSVQVDKFRFREDLRSGVASKRVFITGAGKDGGLGQAFALAAGLNGAAAVGVHFHRSYVETGRVGARSVHIDPRQKAVTPDAGVDPRRTQMPGDLIDVLPSTTRIYARHDDLGAELSERNILYRVHNGVYAQRGIDLAEASCLYRRFRFA